MARAGAASQARAGPSQRNGRRDTRSDDEEEDVQSEEEVTQTQSVKGMSEKELGQKAGQLIRLALFFEYRKRPLPRAEITKQILPNNSRSFNAVFMQAQRQLKATFGMELVEARKAHRVPGAMPETQRRGKERADAENGEEGPAQPGGSKAYLLRSILPPVILTEMSNPRPLPPMDNDDEYRDPDELPDSGSMLRWEKSHSVALLGIRSLILSLILCLGRVVPDDHLHGLLRRLDLHRDTVLPYTAPDSKEPSLTLDKYLDQLAKQNYLEKVKLPNPNGQADEANIEWRWGNREVEFSEAAAAALIEKLFFNKDVPDSSDEEDDDDSGRRGARRPPRDRDAERATKKQKLRSDIAKAAGSALTGSL